MNDTELNDVLKRATVPERGTDYWEQFPTRVTAELERRRQNVRTQRSPDVAVRPVTNRGYWWSCASALRSLGSRPAFALGVAVICVALGLVLGLWRGQRLPGSDPQLAAARKYFREIEALFPNQLQAIVFDERGTQLVLAQEPNLPASAPLYLKICGPRGCQRFVTFSGQQIRVKGDSFEVLVDAKGHVLLVGNKLVWTSADTSARIGEYRFAACPLGISS